MTLQDIYNAIDAHTDTIKRVVGDDRGHMVSVTLLYKLNTGGAGNLRRWIFVKDRNLPTEAAYWDGSTPEYMTTADQFAAALLNQIATYKAAHPEYEISYVVDQNNADMWARVDFYRYDSGAGNSSLKHFIVFRKQQNWLWREIV